MFSVKLTAWPSPLDQDMSVEQFETWRDELIAEGKLVSYQISGKDYLYIPAMAVHENPRNPQAPDVPLPSWVTWVGNDKDWRKGHYEHTTVVQQLYNPLTSPPVLTCPVLSSTDLIVKPVDTVDTVDDTDPASVREALRASYTGLRAVE
ncbi:MAG: hypothetical protein HGA39_09565 [Coriobacteriia bacterium]|nr:hypothetical protein [Coriobacteriia bacterium]